MIKNLKIYQKCLVVVDMVNGFVREGVLHDEVIATIIDKQKDMIEENLDQNNLVIFIKDAHNEFATEFKRFGNTQHCIKDTYEAELVDELKKYEGLDNTISIEKNSTCFMEAPQFRDLIKELNNLKEVDIVGCCTDICVFNGSMGLANYFDQNNLNVYINVYEDAIQTYAPFERQEYINAAKLLMKQQGINIVKR